MTTIDDITFTPGRPAFQAQPALIDTLNAGAGFAIAFGGQGSEWLQPLADLVRDFVLEAAVCELVTASSNRVKPVQAELLRAGVEFDPLPWVDAYTLGESAESDDSTSIPVASDVDAPALSVPGILLTQLLALSALQRQGLDVSQHAPVAVIGHSQGRLAIEALSGKDPVELLAIARLIGAAAQIVGRRRGLLGPTMLSVTGVKPSKLEHILAGMDVNVALRIRNGRRASVLSGPAEQLDRIEAALGEHAATERAAREQKQTGGTPFSPVMERLQAQLAFHHPDLAEAAELVADWAQTCGIDPKFARDLTFSSIIDPVDWVTEVESAISAGAEWILDLGPTDLASRLSVSVARPRGVAIVATSTSRGHRELTVAGATPMRPRAWSGFAPRVVTLPDGKIVVETAFTRLTGKSPILLAGMTPTTVEAPIVAAAANAGFWAELAGGGQVTEDIFADRIAELDELLSPGSTFQFNSLFLDPYLWKLQLGQKRLVQRARATGSPIDGVIVTAGVPELDDAVELIRDLQSVGITHVVFKPGTVAQIRQVLAIARQVAPSALIIQIEGGRAGGHHSWEDLDDLLLAAYAELRQHANVVVCVGGGIGTPEAAARYLTGEWATAHGYPSMPLDGVLVGTAAMATLEAATSPAVKQLLVETPGTSDWVGAGRARGGMASGRSQLGADIHEIDNTASRTGRLLDEVAGDAAAVQARREEIIEALDRTAKPYFGDAALMTYSQWLQRYVDLAGAESWLDQSLSARFGEMLHRAEARLDDRDRGRIDTKFETPDQWEDGYAAIDRLLDRYPHAASVQLHPGDVGFFVDLCRTPGKPVNFVPVIDADVRRWWRSDSLWQAHSAAYGADEVCVIPGIASVAGITRVDEPVAELLLRFEQETVDALLSSGQASARVAGRRRSSVKGAGPELALALASPDVVWAGRTVSNPVNRLSGHWHIVDAACAENSEAGARLVSVGGAVELSVPLGRGSTTVRFELGHQVGSGAAPIVSAASAETAMAEVVAVATAGHSAAAADGGYLVTTDWSFDHVADHAAVTAAPAGPVRHASIDVLVGFAWPAVFAALSEAKTDSGQAVIEGMLDLVHLDHSIVVHGALPAQRTDLETIANVVSVADSAYGRVITVDVRIAAGGEVLATLRERFAIRGRLGTVPLEDPAPAGASLSGKQRDTPRKSRTRVTVIAPSDMHGFASVTGDHNPIHTSSAAAQLAGLGAPIVHGMWTSAAAQQQIIASTGRAVSGWTARFFAPVSPGATVEIRADRVGLDEGAEVLDVAVRADGELVMSASARLEAPRTAYAFPGQGIQSAGMGMAGYQRSVAAREIWDRADRHTREALGFSILTVVRDNPTSLTVAGTLHTHPDGVLYLTQFTQVAMAVLGAAQMAELRESGAFIEGAVLAGHSVGEYNALAAVSGVISLEAVVEVVFQRGSVMHTLVPRDEQGRSDYRLAAIRPSQIGLADDDVTDYVTEVAHRSGEFLQIVNYNLRGSQYAIAGSVQGLKLLEADIARRREEFGGKAAFILVPGIDVPFHSSVLHGGVPDFRARLEELLPPSIDPAILVGRYVPNLVPRPFNLGREFIAEIADLVDSGPLAEVLADFGTWSSTPDVLCRRVLIELLAWQFASPVRWIETQDLMFAPESAGGLGVEQFIEVGVGGAPTVANLASSTLKLPGQNYGPVIVRNIERDAAAVFGNDEDQPEADDDPVAEPPSADAASTPVASTAPAAPTAAAGAPRPDDLSYSAADATKVLLAWWTKLRLDQLGDADSIEALCDGASSRRNQLLVDLGGELSLGAIDGAADADLVTLGKQVNALARSYRPFGSVLTETISDHLKKVLGPTGQRPASITDRVISVWQLGPNWAHHVTAEFALATREGSSVRGGDLAQAAAPSSVDDVQAIIDSSVRAVAQRHGVAVELPASGGTEATIDASALADFTAAITGPDGALASAAHVILDKLGLVIEPAALTDTSELENLAEHVATELGTDWLKATTSAFQAEQAFVLDDRWASAREDLARIAHGEEPRGNFRATGEAVARQAEWWSLRVDDLTLATELAKIASEARDVRPGRYAGEVALVTGAGKGSIAAAVTGSLLAEGATVIATTSSMSTAKLEFFKQLYRDHARAGAVLWVVPANMASFADVDALVEWIGSEQSRTAAGTTTVLKPALVPTMLFPFAAGHVRGDASDAGSRAEVEMRILLWSVERLIGAFSSASKDRDTTLHVVLPGSPNRGLFGGDGAYGEAKAALDALALRWKAERSWADHVTLAHVIIGWVRGTGLMGANDPLVEAVEAQGVRTWSTQEMADAILTQAVNEARDLARVEPVTVDLTGGLGGAELDMKSLAQQAQAAHVRPESTEAAQLTIAALPASPSQLDSVPEVEWAEVTASLDDMVVIVGAGELGPYGSSRTRFEFEVEDRLSAAGVLELAWTTGLITWDATNHGWYDTDSGESVADEDIADRYEDEVRARVGIRRYEDDGSMLDNSAPLLSSVFLDDDLTFTVSGEPEAQAMRAADPDRTVIGKNHAGEWTVTRRAGTEIRVPRRMKLTRTVGGQIPSGFDATAWGIPAEMAGSIDRVALWNLVCTVDAFCSAGFSPAELMRWVHPSQVANTQGTGMGGMGSMHSLYIDTLLGESKPNDILQEALPNVIAAHVVQSYVGSYGAMIHPVAACATTAVSVEEGVDKIRLGKAEFVVAGGFDDLSVEGIVGFGDMSATADSAAMAAKGIEDRRFSRANDRRYGGFVESQGGGTILLARGSLAAELGLPVLGVLAYASSFADGVHTSIPAPGLGALAAGRGGTESALFRSLAELGVGADDIAVLSKHDTSTGVNERNESELHERLAAALGRSAGNPLYVMSQKTLTGHAKGGAAAFQLIGLCQVLASGVIPPNRSLDCVLDDLAEHEHLVWLREPLVTGGLKAGLLTSLGFGHVAGLLAVVHPQAFVEALPDGDRETYLARASERLIDGRLRLISAMYGGTPLYQRPADRRLGSSGVRSREAAMLLDPEARLGSDGVFSCQ